MSSNNTSAFASTFCFFPTQHATTEINKKSLQAIAPNSADIYASFKRHSNGQTDARTANRVGGPTAFQR